MILTKEQFAIIEHLMPTPRRKHEISNYDFLCALLYIIENGGIEGIKAAMIELEYLANAGITNYKSHDWNELEGQVIAIAYATISNDEAVYWAIQQFLQNVEEHIDDTVDVNEVKTILSVLGAQLLNFTADTTGENVHSQMRTWQAVSGYNNLYDDIFSTVFKWFLV